MHGLRFFLFALGCVVMSVPAVAVPVRIVCAERVWCDLAMQVGGDVVTTQSVLQSTTVDPHAYDPSPAVAREMVAADVVVVTGGGYDQWAVPLLPSAGGPSVLDVAVLARRAGLTEADWHLFYEVGAVRAYVEAMTAALVARRPDMKDALTARAQDILAAVDGVRRRIDVARAQVQGDQVVALEPVGQPVLAALGVRSLDRGFAHAVMAESEPSPLDAAGLEDDLTRQRVRALIVNPAVASPVTQHYVAVAQAHGVPVVSIAEALPMQQHWAGWMHGVLDGLLGALR